MQLLLCVVVVLLCVDWSDTTEKLSKLRKKLKNKPRNEGNIKPGDKGKNKPSEDDKYNCEHKASQRFVDDNEQLFRLIDTNGDGDLSPQELKDHYEKKEKPIHISLEEAEKLIHEWDLDKNGKFTKDEWIKRIVDKTMKDHGYDEMFRTMDWNGDNVITKEELIRVFSKGGHGKEAEKLASFVMEVLDCDLSGDLSYEEFKGFLRHHLGKNKEEEDH